MKPIMKLKHYKRHRYLSKKRELRCNFIVKEYRYERFNVLFNVETFFRTLTLSTLNFFYPLLIWKLLTLSLAVAR